MYCFDNLPIECCQKRRRARKGDRCARPARPRAVSVPGSPDRMPGTRPPSALTMRWGLQSGGSTPVGSAGRRATLAERSQRQPSGGVMAMQPVAQSGANAYAATRVPPPPALRQAWAGAPRAARRARARQRALALILRGEPEQGRVAASRISHSYATRTSGFLRHACRRRQVQILNGVPVAAAR